MRDDPKGYYARLDLDRDAAPEEIIVAYRRKARVLHPDVPVTGDSDAFVAVKEAYDVLADPLLRAAYDREARTAPQPTAWQRPQNMPDVQPDPPPESAEAILVRQPRLSDLPLGLWLAFGGVALIASVELVLHVLTLPGPAQTEDIRPNAPIVAPGPGTAAPVPVRLPGLPNAYVLPAGGPAVVWRLDETRHAFVPIGQLPPFSEVQALRVVRDKGLVEIRVSDSNVGFIEASRVIPGNLVAAHEAYCAYDAGATPANGEVLARHGSGPGRLTIRNRGGQPAVVKLRDTAGMSVATVFLQPGDETEVTGLPDGPYRPDFAIGELWSRVCGGFAAGMRAQRFSVTASLSALSPLTIPPDPSGAARAADIPDQAFER
ncbi:MAG TPA: DnaJ domain-containing protein [Acetobacteraceae bacterium]